MKIESKVKKETLAVRIEGRVDMETAPELEKFLDENTNGITSAEFDMKKVDYISSAGLRVFLKLVKELGEKDRVVLKSMNDTVKAVFELTGFTDMFTIK